MVWVPTGDCSNSETQNEEPSPIYQLMSNSYRTSSVLSNLVLFLFRHQEVCLSFRLGIQTHTQRTAHLQETSASVFCHCDLMGNSPRLLVALQHSLGRLPKACFDGKTQT